MLGNFTFQQIAFLAILVTALILLITEKIRNDVVAVLIILSLYISGILTSGEALAGFASEPAIVVASIFVLTGAFHQTGLSETMGGWISRLAGGNYSRILAVVMISVALMSAFTHHVTTTAAMMPVMLNMSREYNISPSKLLMPLSFAASLGTTITIIGAPAFLIASDLLQRAGRPGLGIFTITPIGLALSLAGTLFMLVAGRFLLPDRGGSSEDPANRFRLDNYFTELTILEESPLVRRTISEVEADDRYHFTVVGWMHNGKRVSRPFGKQKLSAGDVLLVRTTPEDIVTFGQEGSVQLRPVEKYADNAPGQNGDTDSRSDELVQAVVAPNSDLIGHTVREIDFRERYRAIVIGLWRRQGWLQQELAKIRLREGDVMLLQGDDEAMANLGNDRNFLMLVPFQGEPRPRWKAPIAGGIMLATIIAAAFNTLSLEMAALAGAVTCVLSRCVTSRQAYRAIDARIYVFIAGAIPLGAAMEKTGTAKLLAGWLQGVVGGWSQFPVLLLLFAIVAVATQFMSDAGTVALFGPVAIALAQGLGHVPEPYIITVAMAAVAAFLTPIGHHGNLLVYGPGRYQFGDFVKVGTPLTVVVGVLTALVASLMWRG